MNKIEKIEVFLKCDYDCNYIAFLNPIKVEIGPFGLAIEDDDSITYCFPLTSILYYKVKEKKNGL